MAGIHPQHMAQSCLIRKLNCNTTVTLALIVTLTLYSLLYWGRERKDYGMGIHPHVDSDQTHARYCGSIEGEDFSKEAMGYLWKPFVSLTLVPMASSRPTANKSHSTQCLR